MLLEGSCHCGAVRFSVTSHTPVPYMQCYCAVCRKTDGGGGYAINLAGDADTLEVTGRRNMTVYRAREELVRIAGQVVHAAVAARPHRSGVLAVRRRGVAVVHVDVVGA